MMFTLVVPLFMLLVFRSSGQSEGVFSHAPELTFPLGAAYSLLLLTNLTYNNFGADGSGMQLLFASPVRFSQIMLGKNLTHSAIFALEVVLVWVGTSLLYRPPSIQVTLATLAGILFALPIDLAAGNLFSIYSPTKIEAGVFGRQRASLTTVMASFGIRTVLFGGVALMLWLPGARELLGCRTNLFDARSICCHGVRSCPRARRQNRAEPPGQFYFATQPLGAALAKPCRRLRGFQAFSGSAMKRYPTPRTVSRWRGVEGLSSM
jgi:hypothetical protein